MKVRVLSIIVFLSVALGLVAINYNNTLENERIIQETQQAVK